jgi:hypothetical protein
MGDRRNKRSVGEQECQTEIGAPDRQRDVKMETKERNRVETGLEEFVTRIRRV